ncbi:MAG: hypothetical protein M3Z36_01815 [Acidobacteriota bacterium]|nr:hypothetical protein [Acidobacteriota bacterium]
MLVIFGGVTLLLLGWACTALAEIRHVLRAQYELASRRYKGCDVNSPVFSLAAVDEQYDVYERHRKEAERSEKNLGIRNLIPKDDKGDDLPYTPTEDIERQMKMVCLNIGMKEQALLRYEFMIEGNLKVKRGEQTIAQATGACKAIPDFHLSIAPVDDMLAEWKDRLANREDTRGGQWSAIHEEARTALIIEFEEWQTRRYPHRAWRMYRRASPPPD